MKRWIHWAAKLYPAAWRRRYEAEFSALLDQAEPRFRDVWDVLQGAFLMQMGSWRFQKLAIALGLVGAVAAAIFAFRMPDRYTSRTVIRMSGEDSHSWFEKLNRATTQAFSRTSLEKMIRSHDLYKAERQSMPIEDIVARMQKDITMIKDDLGGQTFEIQFQYPDAAKVQAATRELMGRICEETPGDQYSLNCEVLDPPGAARNATQPNRYLTIASGFALGLALGLLLWCARRWPAVALTGGVLAVVLAGVSFLIPDLYTAAGALKGDGVRRETAVIEQVLSRQNLARIMTMPDINLYPDDRRKRPMEQIVAQMRKNIRIGWLGTMPGTPAEVMVAFSYIDRYKTRRATRELMRSIIASMPEFQPLDLPNLPERPVGPNRAAIAGYGLLAGLLLGAAAQWVRKRNLSPETA